MTRFAALTTGLAGLALLLTGCGADHNDADVEFATAMIEHHAQAMQMADFSVGRQGIDPRIGELAEEIRATQRQEIDTLAGYLRDWGEEVPETGYATGDSHSHEQETGSVEHADMPGMMSAAELEELAGAHGEDFARLWMQMMVEHHEGAVLMAEDVQEDGEHEGLSELAEDIERVQRTEIGDLRRWMEGA